MAGKIKLEGIPPYDGTYDIPSGGWTNRELHKIKTISGVRAGELAEATEAGDTDVMVALAAVILERNGHTPVNVELLWDAREEQFEVIKGKGDEGGEGEQRPPDSKVPSGTPGGPKSNPDAESKTSDDDASSGSSGTETGEDSPTSPPATGSGGSELTSVSDPPTSAT